MCCSVEHLKLSGAALQQWAVHREKAYSPSPIFSFSGQRRVESWANWGQTGSTSAPLNPTQYITQTHTRHTHHTQHKHTQSRCSHHSSTTRWNILCSKIDTKVDLTEKMNPYGVSKKSNEVYETEYKPLTETQQPREGCFTTWTALAWLWSHFPWMEKKNPKQNLFQN